MCISRMKIVYLDMDIFDGNNLFGNIIHSEGHQVFFYFLSSEQSERMVIFLFVYIILLLITSNARRYDSLDPRLSPL
jgi:hypothetical protein